MKRTINGVHTALAKLSNTQIQSLIAQSKQFILDNDKEGAEEIAYRENELKTREVFGGCKERKEVKELAYWIDITEQYSVVYHHQTSPETKEWGDYPNPGFSTINASKNPVYSL
jgi:hypothetical protein